MTNQSEQVDFWRGEFGDGYMERNNPDAATIRTRIAMWSQILSRLVGRPPKSILEVGANIGLNLRALSHLTDAELWGIEPNDRALAKLVEDKVVDKDNALAGTGADLKLPDGSVEMAFTSGVLIHIHPDDLLENCKQMHRVSSRYIVCIEYFADQPVELKYRDHANKLFKRDFGGYWMDNFPDLQLVDYGFAWKRVTQLDNLTWWIFEKRA